MVILEISQEEAKKSDGIYLDVRRDDERAKGHIENDLHISTKELEDRYEELPKDKLIIVYCGGGTRSVYSAFFLHSKGYNAKSLIGGYRLYKPEQDI
ncbi:MAG: rhodanese-like domain-containing protein [Candidatus Nanoarchaeia archaeon]|jgi:rhodanese-related sulfurtransferase|nr:rhodanese-like domain-containing protein [Candidatus Nanoarchaeia archaeon]